MMMTFCKKSVHSFLGGLSSSCLLPPPPPVPPPSPCNKGLGLITSPSETHIRRPPNVVESASISKSPPPPSSRPATAELVFTEELGGGGGGGFVDGLTSCTESLGFESCDERRIDDDDRNQKKNNNNNNIIIISDACSTAARIDGEIGDASVRWRDRIRERRSKREAMKVKTFPPPISSLNKNGQPNFFLRPVRKDGRLELTEVRIDRPEVLRASREDGRLRLLLIRDDDDDKIDGDDCTTDVVCEGNPEDLDAINEETASHCEAPAEEEEEEEEEREEEEEEEEGTKVELSRSNNENHNLGEELEWSYSPVNGEGFRRCYDLLSHRGGGHYYHGGEMHMWRQHCVTIR